MGISYGWQRRGQPRSLTWMQMWVYNSIYITPYCFTGSGAQEVFSAAQTCEYLRASKKTQHVKTKPTTCRQYWSRCKSKNERSWGKALILNTLTSEKQSQVARWVVPQVYFVEIYSEGGLLQLRKCELLNTSSYQEITKWMVFQGNSHLFESSSVY